MNFWKRWNWALAAAGLAMMLTSCANNPNQEGFIGPEVGDPDANRIKGTSLPPSDPDEVNVDIVKYRRSF